MGTQTRVLRYKSPEAQDMCEVSVIFAIWLMQD